MKMPFLLSEWYNEKLQCGTTIWKIQVVLETSKDQRVKQSCKNEGKTLNEPLERNISLREPLLQPSDVPRGSRGSEVLHEIAIALVLILFLKGAHLISL